MELQSVFAQLYLALESFIEINVPEVRWIDQDLGQLEYYKERPAVNFPCVLIEFPQATYKEEGQHTQWADITVQIRLALDPLATANFEAPEHIKAMALEFYELEHKLVQQLAYFEADGKIQPLNRMSAVTEKREDMYRVRELMFTTATEDYVAQIPANKEAADLEIEIDNP